MLEIAWENPNPPDTLRNELMERNWTLVTEKLRITHFFVGVGQGFRDYFVIAKVPKLGTRRNYVWRVL
jgi:hypothetical protein